MQKLRIGEVLIEMGVLTEFQVDEVLKLQKQSTERKKLGELLLDLGIIDEQQLLDALSRKLDMPVVDLSKMTIDTEAVQMIPEEMARKSLVVAYRSEGSVLYVAANDPLDFYAFENIRQMRGGTLNIVLATKDAILHVIDYYYKEQEMYQVAKEINIEQEELHRMAQDVEENMNVTEDSPIVKLINSILKYAYQNSASDIHIEPHENQIVIRMRKDGVIFPFLELNKNILESINVRIKILSGLDIAEKRIPQDGHFTMMNDSIKLNFRVSFIPTVHGEKAVLRLLNSKAEILNMDTYGMSVSNYEKVRKLMGHPHGIVYVTGPTGSGKTSTLYMMLETLAKESINISTIEDPVEKNLFNINQMQINELAGLTFEVGLRALLRQDPDVIMVGETRDAETAQISARAAITGHLVFSTLHTNDAISTIVRLRDMGLENFMVANALLGSISQRLLRQICPKCKEEVEISELQRKELGLSSTTVFEGKGCPSCDHTGYKGRIAIHEVMMIDDVVKEMVLQFKDVREIERYLKEHQGYETLREQAIRLVKEGKTTIRELGRVLVS